MEDTRIEAIASELLAVRGTGRQIEPLTARYPGFDLAEAYDVAARIVAEKFDRKTHDAVNYAVSDQNLPVEAFLFMQINQKTENREHRQRFVKLRRV